MNDLVKALATLLMVLWLVLCLVLALAPASADAQVSQSCAPRALVVERLAQKYGETRQSMGLGSNNAMMEVFASAETGSWTITVTTAQGVTCMVASGEAFEVLSEELRQGDAL